MKEKINLLFIPFLVTFLGLVLGYSFLNWLIFLKNELFQIKELYSNLLIPMVLSGLIAWLLFRPKLKLLNLEMKNGNLRDFYSFILWIILSIPLIISQEYIITALGKLTELKSINEINKFEATKYYSIKNYYVYKNVYGVYPTFDVSGKYNESLNLHIYFAAPIFEFESDTNNIEPAGWLGIKYDETISNKLELDEKDKKYQEFINESISNFQYKNISDFIYLDRIKHSDKKEGFIEAVRTNPIYKPNEIILEAVNEPFESRNGNKLSWFFCTSIIGTIIWFFMIFIPKIDEIQLIRLKESKPDIEAQEELNDFINSLKPKNGYFITPFIIYSNIIIYIIMVFAGLGFITFKGYALLQWGANYGPLTKGGDWWRLITCTFLHGGLMHLLANMYGLMFIGIFLEPILGKYKYLTLYILLGTLGSISSILWYEATISIGASGAIFGLYGIFLAFLLTKIFPTELTKSLLISTIIFIGFNLLMGISGGIDNAAHFGGLISGFIIGLILSKSTKIQSEKYIY